MSYEYLDGELRKNYSPKEDQNILYTYVLYIFNAKDKLELIKTDTDKPEDVGLEEVLNQMTVLFDEFTFIKGEFESMFASAEVSDLQQESYDLFIEAYQAFEKILNKGLDQIEKKAEITVTTDQVFAALLELYQAQNNLTIQIAAPGTTND